MAANYYDDVDAIAKVFFHQVKCYSVLSCKKGVRKW
jgi:hypothetical protein